MPFLSLFENSNSSIYFHFLRMTRRYSILAFHQYVQPCLTWILIKHVALIASHASCWANRLHPGCTYLVWFKLFFCWIRTSLACRRYSLTDAETSPNISPTPLKVAEDCCTKGRGSCLFGSFRSRSRYTEVFTCSYLSWSTSGLSLLTGPVHMWKLFSWTWGKPFTW